MEWLSNLCYHEVDFLKVDRELLKIKNAFGERVKIEKWGLEKILILKSVDHQKSDLNLQKVKTLTFLESTSLFMIMIKGLAFILTS